MIEARSMALRGEGERPKLYWPGIRVRGYSLRGVAVVAPGLGGDEAEPRVMALDALVRAEDHVVAPHVRLPARPRRRPPEELVDVLEQLEHLVQVLVLTRSRRRVPL